MHGAVTQVWARRRTLSLLLTLTETEELRQDAADAKAKPGAQWRRFG